MGGWVGIGNKHMLACTHTHTHTHTHTKTIWQIMMSVIRGNNREMKWVDLEFLSEDGVCKLRLQEN